MIGTGTKKRAGKYLVFAAIIAVALAFCFANAGITHAADKNSKTQVKMLMVDNKAENKRVKKAFESVGCKVDIVYSAKKIRPEKYDALIIPGGNNITPSIYGQKKHASTYGTNKAKDKLQIKAVKAFAKEKKPILGICRGCQVVNVAFGGTIRQNLGINKKKCTWHRRWGKSKNIKGYWMYKLYGKIQKNYQYHHQCVGKLGKDLVATSYSYKYTYKHIEAIEHKTLPVYGVQWHPDLKIKEQGSKKFFKSFRDICIKEKQKREAADNKNQ